jgi:hypothetical protein
LALSLFLSPLQAYEIQIASHLIDFLEGRRSFSEERLAPYQRTHGAAAPTRKLPPESSSLNFFSSAEETAKKKSQRAYRVNQALSETPCPMLNSGGSRGFPMRSEARPGVQTDPQF